MENVSKISGFKRITRSKAFPLIILFVFLVILFAVVAPFNNGANFMTKRTFLTILQDLAVPGFLTIGAGCLMVSGSIDFSQSAVGAFAGMFMAVSVSWWNLPWFVAIILSLGIAALIGFLNAVLVNELRFMPFIATMAMSSIVNAIMRLVSTDSSGTMNGVVNFNNKAITTFGTYEIAGTISMLSTIMVLAFIFYGLLLAKTKFGRTLYLVGGNPTAARLSGINSKRTSYLLFINCSTLSGLAGLIYSARIKQGTQLALANDQFTGLTAAMLGGISFGGGAGGMGGAFCGLLVIKTFNKGMTIIGANNYLTTVLSGALLLAALSFDYYSQRRQAKRIGA